MERGGVRCEWLTESVREEDILAGFWSPVAAWWRGRFSKISPAQRMAIPAIAAGKNVLVCAPTGTGKTLCAFISILSDLLRQAGDGLLPERVDTVYISPLKALSSDITRNLTLPLAELAAGAGPPVRITQRTGDTTARDRAAMVKRPPHILVTTPESLALCLASAGMRRHLTGIRRIVIDELHSMAGTKRGADLMLSIERLCGFVDEHGGPAPQRIGLSATIAPLERMAEFLVGTGGQEDPRHCAIADAGFARPIELDVMSVFGRDTPFVPAAAVNRGVYDFLETTIRSHRTTLVFTNLRSATERVTFALRKRFAAALDKGESHTDDMIHPEQIQAHHSSLDRDLRLEIERRMKAGELRCVVCSTSLELGIDIGTIDRVVLLNNPRGVARGLQRVGRSGHSLGGVARGTFVPTTPADLIEALVTRQAMVKRMVGQVHYVRNCLDVLAQHVIGMAVQAWPQGIDPEAAFELVRRTAAFADLPRETFAQVVEFLAGNPTDDQSQGCGRLRWETAANSPAQLRLASKGVAGLHAQNVGTIVQEGQVKVRIVNGAILGSIEEAFAQILKIGDRFVLGGSCVRVEGSRGMTVEVTECSGQTPTVPRWFSGMMAMEPGLAAQMREFRAKVRAIAPAGERAIARMLVRQYAASEETARAAAAYLFAQHRYADIPVEGELLVERVPDEAGGPLGGPACVLVFHTMIGRAANEALARVVAYRMQQRFGSRKSGDHAADRAPRGGRGSGGATVVIDDYAFGVWIEASAAARRADRTLVRSLLTPRGFEQDLLAAVSASDLFRSQFRFTAIRAQAILQNNFGRKRFIGQMQSHATRLCEELQQGDPGHPLLAETRRTVLQDILCAPAATEFLAALQSRGLRLLDLATPSPFAFGLFATSRRDTLHLADNADVLLAMYERVRERLAAAGEEPGQAALFY